jgi:phage-related minor tail protein
MQSNFDGASAPQDFADLSRGMADASKNAQLLSKTLGQAFDNLVIKGKGLSDTFSALALSLSQSLLKQAFQPLQQGIGNAALNLFGGGGLPVAFAKGGALQAGTPIPFASGGVVSSPMSFPLSNGRSGLAGERGAEAIFPLSRGADGRLGVAASGAAQGAPITVNITATDIESFQRSETQIAALLARAVSLGQRNL